MALVLDTGIIVALANRDDRHHHACVNLIRRTRESLILPAPTLGEIDYWFRAWGRVSGWRQIVADIERGAYLVETMTVEDIVRAAELEEQYNNIDLGFVDASVIAVCERLGERKVATVDRRHFSIVAPRHVARLELLPG